MKDFWVIAKNSIIACKKHEQYREKECINLIAREGLKSKAVEESLKFSMDLESRYAEFENDLSGTVKKRYYQGQKYITEIENNTITLMKKLFNCSWGDIRLISGTHANQCTFKGISLATKGVLCGGRPVETKYTGFIRKDDEIAKPIIKVEKFYIDDEDVKISKPSMKGTVEVTEVTFIENLGVVISEDKKEN